MKRIRLVFGFEQRMPYRPTGNVLQLNRAFCVAGTLSGEDYEIRLLSSAGGTAMLYATRCVSDAHAREVARQMCTEQFAGFEIWRGQLCIDKHIRVRGG